MNLIDVEHDYILRVTDSSMDILDNEGKVVQLKNKMLKNLMRTIQITSLQCMVYFKQHSDKQIEVLTMYYITGGCFFRRSFIEKYVTGLGHLFKDPVLTPGIEKYFAAE